MPSVRQTNFLGGELAPLFQGRTDLPIFGKGLRTMRNFFASRHGAAVSRPGTKFVHFAGGNQLVIRLVPFVYADDQSFCLEFGHNYVRFHTNGETLANGGAPVGSTTVGADQPYTLATPYAYYDLPNLRWAQTGDILTITHPSYPAVELRRYGNTNWGPLTGLAGTVFQQVQFKRPNPYFRTGYPVLKSPLPVIDATHPGREWIYLVTLTVQDTASGAKFETSAWRVAESWDGVGVNVPVALADDVHYVGADRPMTVWRKNGGTNHLEVSADNVVNNDYRELSMNVYRGRGELFGLVGSTDSDVFVDTGAEPDYAVQPPRNENPFEVKDYAGVAQPELKPSAVAFFQERRVFAVGADLYFSATGDYTNFDRHIINVAGESLHYQLASRKREETLNLVPLNKLLVHTKQAAWSIGGQQGEAIDFDSVDARIEDEVGSVGLPPLVVNGIVYFARAKGVGVRALVPAGDGGYRGGDVTVIAQHLFQGENPAIPAFIKAQVAGQPVLTQRSLIDWAYAEDPWGLIWAVREDGALLSFTPGAENGGGAWARHDTQGYVRAVCSVPEGGEDAVYLAVVRAVAGGAEVMCIERMTSRMFKGSPDDGACLDCSLRYKGVPVTTITGLEHLAGNSVWVVAKGNPPKGPYTVSPGGELTLPVLPRGNSDVDGFSEDAGAHVVLYVGLNFTADLETLDIAQGEVRTKPKTVDFVGFEVDQTQGVKLGQDLDHLVPGLKRAPADAYLMPVPQTQLVRVPVQGAWNLTGRAVLRQELPLWVTVVGLQREVSIGD